MSAKKTSKKTVPATVAVVPSPPPAPVVPLLTRPTGVASGKGTPKAEIRGHEAAVDRLFEIRREAENLEAEEKQLRGPIESEAREARNVLERQTGKTIKSVIVHGTGTNQGRLTWRNSYRAADVAHEAPLRQCLGNHFDTLFTIQTKLKLKDTNSSIVAELRRALGDRFDVLFDATPEIVAQENLMEKRTVISASLTEQQNTALDMILEQLQSTPSLSTK